MLMSKGDLLRAEEEAEADRYYWRTIGNGYDGKHLESFCVGRLLECYRDSERIYGGVHILIDCINDDKIKLEIEKTLGYPIKRTWSKACGKGWDYSLRFSKDIPDETICIVINILRSNGYTNVDFKGNAFPDSMSRELINKEWVIPQ